MVVDLWEIKALRVPKALKVNKANKAFKDQKEVRENLGTKDFLEGLEIMEREVHKELEGQWVKKERMVEVVCLVKLDLEDCQVQLDLRDGKEDKVFLAAQEILDQLV